MPFTFSHPAIILPLNYLPKKWISITGLIIGSITPDFEYFIRMKVESIYSHTILGVFWFDLPLAIILSFIFHNLVKDEFVKNLPNVICQRFLKIKSLNWNLYFNKNWKIIIISILIGILSHLFWDGFTHENGFFVNKILILSKTIEVFNNKIKIFKILQHLSTLIGVIIIVFAIYKLPKNENIENRISLIYWITVLSIILSVFVLKMVVNENYILIGNFIVCLISSSILAIILTPLLLKMQFKLMSF